MDLIEFSSWVKKEMKRQGIPKDAEIWYVDITFPTTNDLIITYDKEDNQVKIVN